jgi:hypothetical protein
MNDKMTARRNILNKLAQQIDDVPAYLKRALATSVANSGITSTFNSDVKKNTQSSYQMTVYFTPALKDEKIKKKLMDNFYNYIQGNRPELSGKVALTISEVKTAYISDDNFTSPTSLVKKEDPAIFLQRIYKEWKANNTNHLKEDLITLRSYWKLYQQRLNALNTIKQRTQRQEEEREIIQWVLAHSPAQP